MFYNQKDHTIRCEWGEQGIRELAPISDVVIIVDVLSFSTSVDIAVGRGGRVWPFRVKDGSANKFAQELGAELAGRRGNSRFSLSPSSLLDLPDETRIVLPSPNGSTLTLAAQEYDCVVIAGSLRNAAAVARMAQEFGQSVAVIPAGERWSDGTLRPAIEDWIGAGAVIAELLKLENGKCSPEANAAFQVFNGVQNNLHETLAACSSGLELIGREFPEDVVLASALNSSTCVPILRNGAYQARVRRV